jgi:hypothetical protein
LEVERGFGDESLDEAGAVLHPLQPRLHQRGELVEAVFGEVGQRPLQWTLSPIFLGL